MKKVLFLLTIVVIACHGNSKNYQKAENAVDAGREFIGACLHGDFAKASFLMIQSSPNKEKLAQLQAFYRQKDKEGRQQYRAASININEITEINTDTTIIKYSNTFDKMPETLLVIRQGNEWLVDLETDKK